MNAGRTLAVACMVAGTGLGVTGLLPQTAVAAELAVVTNQGATPGVRELAAAFERASGHKVTVIQEDAAALERRLNSNGPADLITSNPAPIEELVRKGQVVAGTATPFVLAGLGLSVRAGAPKPDIGTVAALRRTLLETKSIAFTRLGASGVHFANVIERLGIADDVRRKAHIGDAYIGEVVARGEAEMAVQQISELMPVKGIDIVGPLPDDVQKISVFAAGIFRAARNPDAARKLIAHLAEPRLAPVLISKGLEPVRSAG